MGYDGIDWDRVREEATELLSQYIQCKTVNPPGNECVGAEFLHAALKREGIDGYLVESAAGRGNLIAKLRGEGNKEPLLLIHHIDTVPAEEGKWDHPPFSGTVVGSEIWGRGALDCKSLGIMELLVVLLLKRTGFKSKRDIILAATADEEAGGGLGAGWLLDNRPDLLNAPFVINEGGGAALTTAGGPVFLCQTAEKGICWLKVTFSGRPGHASIPHGRNCITEMSRAVSAMSRFEFPLTVTPVVERFVRGMAPVQDFVDEGEFLGLLYPDTSENVLQKIPEESLRNLLKALLRNTAVPTVVKGGIKTNVIPAECSLEVDCRVLPGERHEDVVDTLKEVMGEGDYCVERIATSAPSESPTDTPLYTLLRECLREAESGATLLPFMSSGVSDSRYFRQRGSVAYGIDLGLSLENMEGVHGNNERISVDQLLFGVKVLYETVRRFCQ
jgi:acetylornithine deacetylase/succinyl-diaminopimelate desuccinylase-like protein